MKREDEGAPPVLASAASTARGRVLEDSEDEDAGSSTESESSAASPPMRGRKPAFSGLSSLPQAAEILASSGKLQLLVRLVRQLRYEGRRILIFSQVG